MKTTYLFHINGLHCQSCVLLTQEALTDLSFVSDAQTSIKNNTVQVTGDFGDKTEDEVMRELSAALQSMNYTLTKESQTKAIRWSDFAVAVPIALVFIFGFIFLQKIGIVNLISANDVTYSTAFFIGLIASVSTCMAVVGGIVLSLSANFAKEGDKTKPQLLFHLSRLLSFFFFGGLIGMLGSFIQLNTTTTLLLGIVVALTLFILGLNLLEIFSWTKVLQPVIPAALGKKVQSAKQTHRIITPILIGVASFILPCGFTQSMQLYTLTTGSFFKGGLTMLSFALGTLPVLALLSFSSLSVQKHNSSGIFFKTVGLIVLFFAIFNLLSTLVGAGIIEPFFTL